AEMIRITHQAGKEVIVAANAILHNDKIDRARDYLTAVKGMGADLLMVGDTGLIQILKEEAYRMPYIYDASVLVTSPGQ
ncbi:U32 family peptidase, partial [Streptococcus anginosus]